MTLSGDNAFDVMRTNRLHHWADHVTNQIMTKMPKIMAELKTHGLVIVEPIVLRLSTTDDNERHFSLFDESNRFRIPIEGPWR